MDNRKKRQIIFSRGVLNISCKSLINYQIYMYIYKIMIIILRKDRIKGDKLHVGYKWSDMKGNKYTFELSWGFDVDSQKDFICPEYILRLYYYHSWGKHYISL